jgi:hypothetical protein
MNRFGYTSLPTLREHVRTIVYRELRDVYWGLPRHPQWFVMRKIARFDSTKALIQYFRQRATRRNGIDERVPLETTLFPEVDVNKAVESLKKDGVYLGLHLPPDIVGQVVQYANDTHCYGNGKTYYGFHYREKETVARKLNINFSTGDFYNTSNCQAIKTVVEDPTILGIARLYLGGPPVHQGTKLRWSFSKDASEFEKYKYSQTFHYDLDDYQAMKFFFYLTDVGPGDGPHICIVGSHRSKKFSYKLFRGIYDEAEIINHYNSGNVKHICGNAGYGFVEDISILHKGLTPVKNNRLILIIEYALRDYNMQHDHIEESQLKSIQ